METSIPVNFTRATSVSYNNREDWLAARAFGLGSSDAPAVMGVSRWGSQMSVYADKLGLAPARPATPWQKWGLLLEPAIAADFERQTGYKLFNPGNFTLFQHQSLKFMQVTPDRLIEPVDGEDGWGSLSIKTATVYKASEWEVEPPIEADVQFQHELQTLGLNWGVIAVLIGGQDTVHVHVKRNKPFCDVLVEKEAEFWQKILNQEPPEADGHKATTGALGQIYPGVEGETVQLPADFYSVADELATQKAQGKYCETRIRELENRVRRSMENATQSLLPDGSGWSNKTVKRKGFKVEPTEYPVLRRTKGRA